MKIYTKVVFDMTTLEVIEEKFYEYSGEVAQCFGSGGSGYPELPEYMKQIHARWLYGMDTDHLPAFPDENTQELMEIAWGQNTPGEIIIGSSGTLGIYNPNTKLGEVDTRFDSSETAVAALDADTDYDTFVANAETAADDIVMTEAEVSAAILAYQDGIESRHLDRVSTFTAGMADVNAVHSSQFVIGLGLLERDRARDSNNFAASLRMQVKRDKMTFITNAVPQMIQIHLTKVASQIQLIGIKSEIVRIESATRYEYTDREFDMAKYTSLWDLMIMQLGANIMTSISGSGQPEMQGMSRAQSALGGAFSGAALGASVGGAPGAAVGFLGGGIAGLLGS